MKSKGIKKIWGYLAVALLVLISLWVIYPLIYLISGAFAPGSSIAQLAVVPFQDGFTLEHFKYLFERTELFPVVFEHAVCRGYDYGYDGDRSGPFRVCIFQVPLYYEKTDDDGDAHFTDFPFYRRNGGDVCHFASHERAGYALGACAYLSCGQYPVQHLDGKKLCGHGAAFLR